jgi:glutaredoxin
MNKRVLSVSNETNTNIVSNVEIYGKDGCTYCERAVELCESRNIKYTYYDVGVNRELIEEITERSGIRPRSVPQIFVDSKFISGGFTGLYEYLQVL